jgi:excinuclease UvrABC nuclease subunit
VLYVGKASSLRERLRSYRRAGGDGRFLMRFLEQQARSLS